MTELLDPNYAHLPIPEPKTSATHPFKKWLRLKLLGMAGLTMRRRKLAEERERILLIRPDHLGDVLFLTPALRYLRDLLPQAHISLFVGPWAKAAVENNPHVDEILVGEFPGFTRQPKGAPWRPYRYLYQQASRLKAHHFDMAVILRPDHWWGAWLAAAAGIPRRFGYAVPEVAPFLTDALPYREERHEVEQNWRLVHHAWSRGTLTIIDPWSDREIMGRLEFFIPEMDQAWAESWLHEHNISFARERPLIVIHPGAGAAVKLWRPEAWGELAQALTDQYQGQIVLTGSPDEVELCNYIASQITPAPLVVAGQTTLSQLAALMANATLALGPDTGPLKLAAAVGAPTLELYGPVDVRKFGPWPDLTRQRYVTSAISCIPCNYLDYKAAEIPAHFCVRGLSVAWVLHEVRDLLAQHV